MSANWAFDKQKEWTLREVRVNAEKWPRDPSDGCWRLSACVDYDKREDMGVQGRVIERLVPVEHDALADTLRRMSSAFADMANEVEREFREAAAAESEA